jgi:surfactin synthase thioesterase subunit
MHPTWYLLFTTLGVSSTDNIPKEEIYAYVDLLKREDKGKAFLKIMRNFDHSTEFRELCYSAVQNVPYPIQAIWGARDPALDIEHFGNQIREAASLKEIFTVDSRHFLPEESWKEIARKIAAIAQPNKSAS